MLCKPQSIAEQIHPQRDTFPAASPCQIPTATVPGSCCGHNLQALFSSSFLRSTLLKAAMTSRCRRQVTIAMNAVLGCLSEGCLLGWWGEGSGKMNGMWFVSGSLCQVKESLFRHLLAHTRLLGVLHHRCRFPAMLPLPFLCLFGLCLAVKSPAVLGDKAPGTR